MAALPETKTKYSECTNRTTVGHKDHDITFKKLPMYSFPKSENKKLKTFGPGPAAYPQNDEKQHGQQSLYPNDQSFKYSLGARRCFENRSINPGPAAYPITDNDKTKYFNDKLPINGLNLPKRSNQFSFGAARKQFKNPLQTEPALFPSISRSIMLKEEKNKFTFAGRPKPVKSRFETPAADVYPIFKREKMNSKMYSNHSHLHRTHIRETIIKIMTF